jgi:hypothetical protein
MLVLRRQTGGDMDNHQDMSQHLGRTQLSAQARLGELAAKGHTVVLGGDTTHAVATLTSANGEAHHIMVTPGILDGPTRRSHAFRNHPQSVLLARVIHAICDWSDSADARATRNCRDCPNAGVLTACYNPESKGYDWYCPTCLYGEAA